MRDIPQYIKNKLDWQDVVTLERVIEEVAEERYDAGWHDGQNAAYAFVEADNNYE